VRDKTLGGLMCILSALGMTGYFYWLFLTPQDILLFGRSLSDWALIIPVVVIVYAFLFVVAWIGWTMVSTPPPLPVPPKRSQEKKEAKA
jgi:membrane protein implicated in regulation of membrane protease activity